MAEPPLPPFLASWPDGDSARNFYRSLSAADRQVLDDLFARAELQAFAIRNARSPDAPHPLPYMIYLVSLLIEEHKEVARLRREIGFTRKGTTDNTKDTNT